VEWREYGDVERCGESMVIWSGVERGMVIWGDAEEEMCHDVE
jgi:hypothetical protein